MANGVRLLKRYAGVRLYDPAALAYVSAQQVRQWHGAKVAIVVQDAATGEDVTSSVLETKPDEH